MRTAVRREAVAVHHAATSNGAGAVRLDDVRGALLRQEDSIIFALIERAQFARNEPVYESGAVPVPAYTSTGRCFTFLEYFLRDTEATHGRIRRYTSPDEHAFFPEALPPMVLKPQNNPTGLAPGARDINLNSKILPLYLNTILPGITEPGDDGHYGSSAMLDVLVLQALSKRVHYGKFIAEAKFVADAAAYENLITRGDAEGLMDLLTFPDQEARVIARVASKAAIFGQDIDGSGKAMGASYKVEPDLVADLYREWVMPLTKEVQVQYLLRRLDC